MGDIEKKVARQEAIKAIEELVNTKLLGQEYVVICRQTSNQINRMHSRDAVNKMAEAGIFCSCGSAISDERIEELFSSTQLLQKMLDQSYWTTAKLVQVLRQLGIQDNCILLNLHQGPEEIDAFVDMDGALLMFELKDNEFSMGHAYPFGGRIGLYKPDYALIVSTSGVAPDVKEYFKQVKPQSTIVYVDQLSQLALKLQEIMNKVRSQRAGQILSDYESVTIPVAPILASKIGLQLSSKKASLRIIE